MKTLLDDSKSFWSVNTLEEESFRSFLSKRIRVVSTGLLLFNTGCVLAVFTWTTWTVFTKTLLYICYVPNNSSFWFYVIYISQVYLWLVALLTVLGYVYFFAAVVVNIIVQYRILQYELLHIKMDENEADVTNRLRCCIEHHAFLIR